ncbi:hypothetical protein ASPWEDRAFT_342335 [Aspergillus wentii DTO 134E9]|uniref:Zn(2)-C6 fungal-type domain-containing protein n=1 Tax=Aspergillus wentii DTO 134E9 TaxID=1073089 RepID=A0A1L9RV57_ASPWE|nr:uncharacterized protein ASPWEDRAFT_342335 [Aspergillus wentii DTO 134E9]OJJ38806.1 hypothetical protein ASPWEDRAFT_342335 [Aspergillus wentii DTO 134E9]
MMQRSSWFICIDFMEYLSNITLPLPSRLLAPPHFILHNVSDSRPQITMPRNIQMVQHACDGCRRRKIKCTIQRPCSHCQSAGLECRVSRTPQRKGRQGKTANILSQLKKQPDEKHGTTCHFKRPPAFLSKDLIQSCSDYFFAHLRGTVPVICPDSLADHIQQMDDSLPAYTIVTAFCAFVLTQTGYLQSHPTATSEMGCVLVREATQAHRHSDPLSDSVCQNMVVSFLLYGCHIGLGNQRHAYWFLREATTIFTAGMLDNPMPEQDKIIRDRLFWLLFVSERAHAIRRHRPVTLHATQESPILDTNLSDSAFQGFRCLVDLYRPLDDRFLGLWNGTNATCSIDYLVQLQQHIQNAVPAEMDLPDVLMADLRVSQQWLRTMVWQLSTTLGFLSSDAVHPCMEFQYPIQIARNLSVAIWKLSPHSMETHGIGLIEKIFEVSCTLIDVMACLSSSTRQSSAFQLGPQDHLKHFCSLVCNLHGGRQRFLPLLLNKVGQTLPSMMEPIMQHLNLQAAFDQPMERLASGPVNDGIIFNQLTMSRIGDRHRRSMINFFSIGAYWSRCIFLQHSGKISSQIP